MFSLTYKSWMSFIILTCIFEDSNNVIFHHLPSNSNFMASLTNIFNHKTLWSPLSHKCSYKALMKGLYEDIIPWASLVDSSFPFLPSSLLVTCVTPWLVVRKHNPCALLSYNLSPPWVFPHPCILALNPSSLLPINWSLPLCKRTQSMK